MSNLLAIRETTGGKRSVYNNCDIHCTKRIHQYYFISEVGSSHDFDGDFMMSSLISITQVGSNTESLQCVAVFVIEWQILGKRTADVLNFCDKKV